MSKETIVMKFGGTSVGSTDALTQVIRILQDVRDKFRHVIIIASAMSDVTDLLLDSAMVAGQRKLDSLASVESFLKEKHFSVAESLIMDTKLCEETKAEIHELLLLFIDLCKAIAVIGDASPRALDAVSSLGERMSVRLLAAIINSVGIKAKAVESTEFIITNSYFQNARPDFRASSERILRSLNPLLNKGIVPIITGYIGATPEGAITTLGRGGSDYTATLIGSVLRANVWIWTDVDGVMTMDPRIVSTAKTLSAIGYSELIQLAYSGAKVLHPRAIRPAMEAGIQLRICNTFNPSNPGTRLTLRSNRKTNSSKQPIKAITFTSKQKLVTLEGYGILDIPGAAARTFGTVMSLNTSIRLITEASCRSISFTVQSDSANQVLDALQRNFELEISSGDINRIWATDEIAIITIVGQNRRSLPRAIGQVLKKLSNCNINVLAVAYQSSAISIYIVVEAKDAENAVKTLHKLITE